MLIDVNQADPGTVPPSDVCIVGAGAAGIPLALALARHGRSVVLLESGGLRFEADTQALYDGVTVGDPYLLSASRLRYFGGSTNHWGGLCHELDEDDFLPRRWIPDSGWPMRKADLDPYYVRALQVLEIPARQRFEDVEQGTAAHPRFFGPTNGVFEPLLWLKSPPARLGLLYRDEIAGSPRIRCYLHMNAVEVLVNEPATAVVALRVKTLGGREFRVSAQHYVLSAGGIENARLLLLSDSVVAGGVGNAYDLVGRYFQEHPNIVGGTMVVAPPAGSGSFQEEYVQARARKELGGVWDVFFGFVATPATKRRHRLLGCSINANCPDRRALAPTHAAIEELVGGAADGGRDAERVCTYGLGVIAEQAPNRDSRVFLTDVRDALGQRKIAVNLQVLPCDVRSIGKTLRLFAFEVARSGRGRVRLDPLPDSRWTIGPGHHMGTTRMSDDPAHGVTDRDGRVHGIANLYVAGSSLFPTGGYANPTLTIVALALRQADRIAARQPRPVDVR